MVPMRRLTVAVITALGALACQQERPALAKEATVSMIESSPPFRAPIDPAIVFVDATFRPGPNTRRQVIEIEGIAAKDNGPLGLAGATATATFTWQWTEGPFAGRVFRSKAKFNSSSGAWKIYDDYLKHQLSLAERGEED